MAYRIWLIFLLFSFYANYVDARTISTLRKAARKVSGRTGGDNTSPSTDTTPSTNPTTDPSTTPTTEYSETTEYDLNADPLTGICKRIPPVPSQYQLKCYTCKSNTHLETDPVCDTILWRHALHSEKARLRSTCDGLKGKFCVKITKRKYLERITERGCFTDTIKKANNETVKAQNGCIKFTKDGVLTTVCFCDQNYCNGANRRFIGWNDLPYLIVLSIVLLNLLEICDEIL